MKYINIQICMYALLASTSIVFAEDTALIKNNVKDCWLKVGKLCAEKIKTQQICATKADLQSICSERVRAKCGSFEREFANSACINDLRTKRASIENITTNTVCAQLGALSLICTTSIQAQNICVNGNLEQCTCWKAVAGVDPAYTYTFGDPIIFNTIIDDPCLSFLQTATEGTVYVAPRNGYYLVEFETNFRDLAGTTVITGVPVVQNTITVNGLPRRIGRYAILTFSLDQINSTAGLIHLNKGDRVGGRLHMLVQDPTLGQIAYQGTVLLDGGTPVDQTSPGGTLLIVHYLSSDCPVECGQPCPSLPCQTVSIDCPSISINCDACDINCECIEDNPDECDCI